MSKTAKYTLKINSKYLRTEPSELNDREKEPIEGRCNNFNDRKEEGIPLYIMEHHTVSDLDRSIHHFTKGGVSAHYLIAQDGEVYHLVADDKRAYHAGAGSLKFGSKLHHIIPDDTLKGRNKEGELGKGVGDMNSWSIGIENVNNAFEPFTPEQTLANLYLHEKLISEHKIDPRNLLSHADWTPGRKVDPSPYYDWQALATASDKHEDIEHNFGVYPTGITYKANPEVIVSYKTGQKDDIIHLQGQLEDLGYPVLEADDRNLGIYDTKTRDASYSFVIRYMNGTITGDHEKLALWHLVDYKGVELKEMARGELATWTENHDLAMSTVLDLYSEG